MIFLDSSFVVAYKVENDEHHDKAIDIMIGISEGKYGDVVISDYVFDEVVTVLSNKTKNIRASIEVGDILLISSDILYLNKEIFENAWRIFKEQEGTKFSFIDCSNLAVMERMGIKNIATFDGDFKKIKGIEVVN